MWQHCDLFLVRQWPVKTSYKLRERDMQQQVTDLVLKFLRQGFTIEQIEQAFVAELETIRKSAPMLKAQKEAVLAP
jgi:alkyl sulfatase BDS1-like metallo-beta-lactamase superfamily hydrolase